MTWISGGRARRAFDDLEGALENRRQRKRVVEAARLNFTVHRRETAGGGVPGGGTAVGVDRRRHDR